jgi:hypothetical protein
MDGSAAHEGVPLHDQPPSLSESLHETYKRGASAPIMLINRRNEPPRRQERQEENKILAFMAPWRFDFLLVPGGFNPFVVLAARLTIGGQPAIAGMQLD